MEHGEEKKATDDVVVVIPGTGKETAKGSSSSPSPAQAVEITPTPRVPEFTPASEIVECPTPLVRSFPLSRLKSRFSEPPSRVNETSSPNSAAARTPIGNTDDDGDDEGVYTTSKLKVCGGKLGLLMISEWTIFVFIVSVLISSLTFESLKHKEIWDMKLSKWSVLVMVLFCGRLISDWFVNIMVFLVFKNLMREKFMYFIYGVKTSVRFFIWLCMVLVSWGLVTKSESKSYMNRLPILFNAKTNPILNFVSRVLVGLLVVDLIWLLKTLLVITVASKYQCKRFFERIRESIFHQYVLRILSVPKAMEMGDSLGKSSCCKGFLHFINIKQHKEEDIDIRKLIKVKSRKVSAWAMKGLVNIVSGSELSIVSDTLDDDNGKHRNHKIDSEKQTQAAGDRIFSNVAKQGAEDIEKEDLAHFLNEEEVKVVLNYFGAADTIRVGRSAFKNWLVSIYVERKALTHSLNDAKTTIDELNRLLSAIVGVLVVLAWLLCMEFLTTQALLFLSSQLVLVAFVFGNAAKTVFEALIFVFVMHPFDVHDRCVIDGVQVVVEEIKILTTVFLKQDGEKIWYPNSVLSTKAISNFNRSPDMGDSVMFDVHVSSSASILPLKGMIQGYLESNPEHWRANHTLLVKEIENGSKMKMALYVTHTMNFQEYMVKSVRRSELVLELKKYFEELGIEYRILPQEEVHIKRNMETSTTPFAQG